MRLANFSHPLHPEALATIENELCQGTRLDVFNIPVQIKFDDPIPAQISAILRDVTEKVGVLLNIDLYILPGHSVAAAFIQQALPKSAGMVVMANTAASGQPTKFRPVQFIQNGVVVKAWYPAGKKITVAVPLHELGVHAVKGYSLWVTPELTTYWYDRPKYTINDVKIACCLDFLESAGLDDFPHDENSPLWDKVISMDLPVIGFYDCIVADMELSIVCPMCGEADAPPLGTPKAGNSYVCGGCGCTYKIREAKQLTYPMTHGQIVEWTFKNISVWYTHNTGELYFSETANDPADSHIINTYDIYRDARITNQPDPNQPYTFSYWLINLW